MPDDRPTRELVIVGGGLAGLSTAVALADAGLSITLLESRPRLGGRASSFIDPKAGLVDNCQHVGMACCTNLVDFCRRIGVDHLFRRVDAIRFLDRQGRRSTLKGGWLPAPLHLSGSFLRANYLTMFERLRVAYGVAMLRWWKPDPRRPDESVEGFLRRNGQTDRTLDRYWSTVLVSALNDRLDRLDIGHARKVFVDGFLRHRDGYRVDIPSVPLGELYGVRGGDWLKAQGVDVRLGTGIRRVRPSQGDRRWSVETRSGASIDADLVVVAVPFDRVSTLFDAETLGKVPELLGVGSIESAPITGVHLWFDREVCPVDHLALVDRRIHWIFNHSAPVEAISADRPQYLQVVISDSRDWRRMGNDEALRVVLDDIHAIWPGSSEARLVHHRVVTEHSATFCVTPGIDAHRPEPSTSMPGLYLAGDWTRTGWPATMEGAVRSGYRAAEAILRDLGRPTRLVRPDLPAGILARWLLGIGRGDGPSISASEGLRSIASGQNEKKINPLCHDGPSTA